VDLGRYSGESLRLLAVALAGVTANTSTIERIPGRVTTMSGVWLPTRGARSTASSMVWKARAAVISQ